MKVILLSVLFVAAPVFADPLEFPAGIDALKTYAETLKGERRKGAEFLLKHLPASDRESLSLPLFQENLEEAFVAREGYLWTKALPQDLFFNEVLPHAVVTETRDGWRKMLRGMFDPMLEECETIEDVCRVVGSQVKERTGVKYSTKREKACQSPAESIRQGKASCTGLSILMVDALRAAGVPARLVAIPLWGTKEGNHTWVEVHDGKAWRFTGYGGMPARWDQGWEIARCAYCDPMEPIHGVFASSYRMTPVGFPTIWEWGRLGPGAYCRQERDEGGVLTRVEWSLQKIALGGVDRTTHYIALAGGRKLPIPKGKSCVAVRATLSGSVTRVDLPVRVFRGEQRVFEGRTASEALDRNDYVRIICEPGDLQLEYRLADGNWEARTVKAQANKEVAVKIEVTETEAGGILSLEQRRALATWFRSGGAAWPAMDWPALSDASEVDRARKVLWSLYRDARRLDPASKELGPVPPLFSKVMEATKSEKGGLRTGSLTIGKHQMPFVLIRKETKPVPERGRALYICMHGGGRYPKADGPHAWPVNSREWQSQAGLAAKLYAGEGIFFVPRMADDRLGRWHHALNQDAFDAVIEHGLREWNVDPNRVYLMGISEGCYGTQILGPFMPDRFAGACAMAGGVGKDVPAENLRNLAFRTDVGENDTTFNRVGLAREYHARMDAFAKTWGGYENSLNVQEGKGHGIDYKPGPEWMVRHTRHPLPDTVVWTAKPQDKQRRTAVYWLGLEGEQLDGAIKLAARIEGNTIKVNAHDREDAPLTKARVRLMLNDGMLDLAKPLQVMVNGEKVKAEVPARSVESLARTLTERGDPNFAFPVEVVLEL